MPGTASLEARKRPPSQAASWCILYIVTDTGYLLKSRFFQNHLIAVASTKIFILVQYSFS